MPDDPTGAAEQALQHLWTDAVEIIDDLPADEMPGVALADSERDRRFESLGTFEAARSCLAAIPDVATRYGVHNARRLTLQFVYSVAAQLRETGDAAAAFDGVWRRFLDELAQTHWTYFSVANLHNFDSESREATDLGGGVSIRPRNYAELSTLLGWNEWHLQFLTDDWRKGAPSSFVLIAHNETPKTPDNLPNDTDGNSDLNLQRALQSMRLSGQGDVYIGPILHARPAFQRWADGDGFER